MVEDSLALEILQEVTRIANSTLDLDETLESIIDVIKHKMRIDACSIYLWEEDGSYLRLRASSGFPAEIASNIKLEIGKGITGWAAQTQTTVAVSEALNDPRSVYFPEIEEEKFQSILSVPMIIREQCIGVINVHTVDQREFTAPEISILETIANQVSGCIRNAMLYRKSKMLLKEQTILYDISLAVQTTLKLEHGLWIILSGITMGEAGGFNRAMLFTINERTNVLQGMMGLGPDSPDDAFRVWSEWGRKKKNMFEWIVQEADKDQYKSSAFNNFVRSLNFPIRPGENILTETVIQKKPFKVTDARNDPLVSEEFIEMMGTDSFASVPLIAHEEVLGVILVDNRYNNKPITEEQLRLLTRFTPHASWVMENSRLFAKLLETNRELLSTKEQLIQTEKLAALGKLSAEIAHEVKNPLVSIGGFARRLKDKVQKIPPGHSKFDDLQDASKYADIIVTEVDRLEKLLKNILLYSTAGTLELEECHINSLVDEVTYLFKLGFYEKNISLHCDLAKDLTSLPLDKQKVKQVLINLFYNSIDSMPMGGKLMVRTYNEEYSGQGKMVTVRIEDTGGGIPADIFENIFNPFFTTKHSGTGLGLSISRKIVENHGGTIRIENNVGQGVTIYLYFPLQ